MSEASAPQEPPKPNGIIWKSLPMYALGEPVRWAHVWYIVTYDKPEEYEEETELNQIK